MAKYQGINIVLNKNQRDAFQASFIFKDVTSTSSQGSRKIDLQGILELLNTTNDVNLQMKMFSALSAYLMFNKGTNLDVIVKCSAVYERIHNVLEKGLQRRAADALNFLSALLYVDMEDGGTGITHRRTLALYAKNMTRVSGCLGTMADMFTNSMMYHDTWKTLCQCLAAVCSGCETNQSYCTHLIPVCVRKCSQANIDICLVLQSLINNHKTNIQLFLDCNGTAIFTRDLLHYDKCLQLLITVVVQCSSASSTLRKTNVPQDLRDFAQLYGPKSQIGQKALIILYNIDSRAREPDTHISKDISNTENQNQTIKIHNGYEMNNNDVDIEPNDTKTLMQNVMKEIYNYNQNDLGRYKETASKVEDNHLVRRTSAINVYSRKKQILHRNRNESNTFMNQSQRNKLHCNIATNLSFSFLQNLSNRGPNRNNNFSRSRNVINSERSNDVRTDTNTVYSKRQALVNNDTKLSVFYKTVSDDKPTSINLKDFRPCFSSTPKRDESLDQMDFSKMTMCKSNITAQPHATQQVTTKLQKRRPKTKTRKTDKVLKNVSLGFRFFNAINDSCTTLVKTVANIFKKKDTPDCTKDITLAQSPSSLVHKNRSCSYSFLNYMKKRDAVSNNNRLKKRNTNFSDFSLMTKSCETCDDTELLKQKLAKDEHLKKTIKKLKLGINLYGCDFKKISKTMWSRESYMTPVVLYNLYRKLLLK